MKRAHLSKPSRRSIRAENIRILVATQQAQDTPSPSLALKQQRLLAILAVRRTGIVKASSRRIQDVRVRVERRRVFDPLVRSCEPGRQTDYQRPRKSPCFP